MRNLKVLLLPGDGIGQEVTAVGKKVLDRIAEKFGHNESWIKNELEKFSTLVKKYQL